MATLTCESCGAHLEPTHLTCPFCKATTAIGLRQHEQAEQTRYARESASVLSAQHTEIQSRTLAQGELDRIARQSMIWSLVGIVFCCAPIPSLVALVLAYRARVVAREKRLVFPAGATTGLIVGTVTLLTSVVFYAYAGVSAVAKQGRIHTLEQATSSKGGAETLDGTTACQLVELHLLEHGLTATSETIDNVRCDGALDQHGAVATLHDVTFEASSAFHTADATLRRGSRWVVESVADASPHAAATTTNPASPGTTPKAIPSAHLAPPPTHHDAGAPKPH